MVHSLTAIDYQRLPRPVALYACEYQTGVVEPRHSHERSQLLYACTGVMSVSTDRASYVIPPQRALWVPAGIEHEVRFRTKVSLRTLYINPYARPELSSHCRVIAVSNLLRELVLAAAELPIEYDLSGREARIMELILDEMSIIPDAKLYVPMPTSKRLVDICQALLQNPARTDSIEYFAHTSGYSKRTFTRLFRKETGMSFGTWRQHVRLQEALSRLAAGRSITTVAFEVGYSSQSAFTAMFHRVFGATPTDYLAGGKSKFEQSIDDPG